MWLSNPVIFNHFHHPSFIEYFFSNYYRDKKWSEMILWASKRGYLVRTELFIFGLIRITSSLMQKVENPQTYFGNFKELASKQNEFSWIFREETHEVFQMNVFILSRAYFSVSLLLFSLKCIHKCWRYTYFSTAFSQKVDTLSSECGHFFQKSVFQTIFCSIRFFLFQMITFRTAGLTARNICRRTLYGTTVSP